MAEQRYARPVSGEIMIGAAQRPLSTPTDDIVDAEFETIGGKGATPPAVATVPDIDPPTDSTTLGMDVLKPDAAQPARVFASRGGPAFWALGAAIVAAAFWVSGGHALVRTDDGPPVATGLAGFRIDDVTSRVEDAGGRLVLFVDGTVVNTSDQPRAMPPVEIAVSAADGRITRYKLGTSPGEIAGGARFNFSSRLEAPKDGVKAVTVDFSESP